MSILSIHRTRKGWVLVLYYLCEEWLAREYFIRRCPANIEHKQQIDKNYEIQLAYLIQINDWKCYDRLDRLNFVFECHR